MLLEVSKDSFDTNIIGSNKFTIEASAKAFKILSGGIYSNTKRAIVRELSCNAYDAHVDAGVKDVPFDVVLPTKLTPFFEIRDYGTGLSDEDINHLYTTYFSSTKTGSNDFVGALGLGSKSPFSYSDSFVVTSYFDGVASAYLAFVDETGNPSISRTSSNETSEKNGLKVKVPVKVGDYDAFLSEATYVYATFDTHPNFIGRSIDCVRLCSNKFGGIASSFGGYGSHFFAVQGNVKYRIDHNYISLELKSMFRGDVDLFFNIGDLGVASSREEIAYDEGGTKKAIKDKCDELLSFIKKDLKDNLDKCETLYDAVNTFYSFELDGQLDLGLMDVEWRNKDIKPHTNSAFKVELKLPVLYNVTNNRASQSVTIKKNTYSHVSFHDKLGIIIDEKKNFRRKILEYCDNKGVKLHSVVIIKSEDTRSGVWSKVLRGMPVMRVSDMPAATRCYSSSSSKKTSNVKVYDSHCLETEKDLKDVKFYIEMNRWEPVNKHIGLDGLRAYADLNGLSFNMIKTINIPKLPKTAVEFTGVAGNIKEDPITSMLIGMSREAKNYDGLLESPPLSHLKMAKDYIESKTNNEKVMLNHYINKGYKKANIPTVADKYPIIAMYRDLMNYDKAKHRETVIKYLESGEKT